MKRSLRALLASLVVELKGIPKFAKHSGVSRNTGVPERTICLQSLPVSLTSETNFYNETPARFGRNFEDFS